MLMEHQLSTRNEEKSRKYFVPSERIKWEKFVGKALQQFKYCPINEFRIQF